MSAALIASAAAANQPAAGGEDSVADTSGGVQDIVVTAQRRGQSLQEVPIAITAVTAETTSALNIQTAQDVTQLVPGFTFQRQASGASPFIRGVGSTSSFIGNEPSVAYFVDDSYIANGNAAIFEFNNIEMIEVLKGPQGTLFGRNATGGVIHVRTRDPSFTPTADLAFSYGNYNTINAQVYASAPITDNIAVNVSAFRVYQGDGWGVNVLDGQEVFKNSGWGVRSKLLARAGDNTDILLSGTFSNRNSSQGIAMRSVSGTYGFAGANPDALGAGFYDSVSSAGVNNYYDTEFMLLSAKIDHDFGAVRFVSISTYSDTTTNFRFDLDAAPMNILNATVLNEGKTFTQEIQLLSNNSSRLEWIVGGYFLKDNSLFHLVGDGLAFASYGVGTTQTQRARQKTTSIAVFGQGTYEIVDNLKLTLGLRYTNDRRTESEGGGSLIAANGDVIVQSGPFGSKTTFGKVTGRAAIDYRLNEDILLYASFNRGFKSGVYNLPGYSPGSTSPLPPVKPEVLDAFAVGFKSDLFDRLARLNVEAFYYDFTNIQFQNNVPPPNAGTILSNAGKAEIKGMEAELQIVPSNRLTIMANISVIDGKYTEFPNGPTFFPQPPNAPIPIPAGCNFTVYPTAGGGAPAAQRFCDLTGSKTVNTPPFAATVSVLYDIPTPIGDFSLAGSYSRGGNYFSEPHNLQTVHQPITNLVNASITWRNPGDDISIKLWANNLTDQEYYSYVANGGSSGPKYSPASPRTYGITLGAHF
ncbi:TonB-dependent receptor [Sandaracinobacter sp. RS1-74]|uniref:TonB-dependent receptor n=1 Tax=Sandaracinobacteroides sayramensis TaxID=2913411 RepID=UPI001ED9DB60|nr:TonB-dependent receptor [Sandaracinobacteroides sayramensis]MCG2840903.1 TonB-dependent receptor [Sandaracinobacteroides sayramensis]